MRTNNRIPDLALVACVLALCVLLGLQCSQAFGAPRDKTFGGTVVKVHDADTIWVERDRVTHKVRVLGIDAPESDQPWGKEATKAASDQTLGKEVIVTWRRKDRYGRVLGSVKVGDRDLAAALVKDGHAWVYRAFPHDKSLVVLEDEAKKAKRGLWAADSPIAPWEWRRGKR